MTRKANDNIPRDEMLLAKMLCGGDGFALTRGDFFRDDGCCAVGALHSYHRPGSYVHTENRLSRVARLELKAAGTPWVCVAYGNDKGFNEGGGFSPDELRGHDLGATYATIKSDGKYTGTKKRGLSK